METVFERTFNKGYKKALEDYKVADLKLRLKAYDNFYGNIAKCRNCAGYYVKGFICNCGEDNSTSKY